MEVTGTTASIAIERKIVANPLAELEEFVDSVVITYRLRIIVNKPNMPTTSRTVVNPVFVFVRSVDVWSIMCLYHTTKRLFIEFFWLSGSCSTCWLFEHGKPLSFLTGTSHDDTYPVRYQVRRHRSNDMDSTCTHQVRFRSTGICSAACHGRSVDILARRV